MKTYTLIPLDWSDPRLEPYRNLKDRTLRGENLFIAEGELVTQRLAESRYPLESMFVDQRHVEAATAILKNHGYTEVAGTEVAGTGFSTQQQPLPVYVSSTEVLRQVVGYDFHLGMMAMGVRLEETNLARFMGALRDQLHPSTCSRLVILPACVKPDNLGSVFRSSTALGVDGIILGTQSCDPLGRRTLRTSMAATVKMPWIRSSDLMLDLRSLQTDYGFSLVGTVLRPEAVPLDQFTWPEKTALLLGNEYDGLDEPTIALCDSLVTIPMANGVDSLNLGVSAGVFLYSCSRRQ